MKKQVELSQHIENNQGIFNGNVVKAKVGHFIVIGFMKIVDEEMAMLKPFNFETKEIGKGQIALPLEILTPA